MEKIIGDKKSLKDMKFEPKELNFYDMFVLMTGHHPDEDPSRSSGRPGGFQALGLYRGAKVSAFVSKNMYILSREMKRINQMIEDKRPTKEQLKDYVEAEKKMFESYAKKDGQGNAIHDQRGKYDIPPEQSEAFDAALKELRESDEYKVAWQLVIDFNDFEKEMRSELVKIDFHHIFETDLPEEMTGQDRFPIEEFIVSE